MSARPHSPGIPLAAGGVNWGRSENAEEGAVQDIEIVYVGPLGSVVVPDLGPVECEHGKPVKVPGELAERLLEQTENWRRAVRARASGGQEE